jgi:hypothetical protein
VTAKHRNKITAEQSVTSQAVSQWLYYATTKLSNFSGGLNINSSILGIYDVLLCVCEITQSSNISLFKNSRKPANRYS